ncbi:invasion associated locus B family protein [Bradyrhizobium japonicum]|uniref:invasion associated locus B family protein n=1 Tax=Bradyrhizobium japonicum TaxID=375 RepID=UPI001BAA6E47|nr:invasion associated locus B family protein [Bradyrhizobium japonicum]MBR0956644.1 invasion associated locus B family protein [Bradyrhizobium japonicum]
MIKIHHSLTIALFALACCEGAQAQTQTPTQAQAPQRTTATYEDWTVRCEVSGTTRVCEMTQAMQIQGQAQPVTQIAIGQQSKGAPLKMVVLVPINVALTTAPKLAANDKDPGIATVYRRCMPAACFADTDIGSDQIKRLRVLSENGKLQFKDAAQQDVVIPVSFKGFGQAFDAMQQP